MRRRTFGALAGVLAVGAFLAVAQVFSTSGAKPQRHFSKLAATASAEATPGEGPSGGLDAYLAAQRTYPADQIPADVAEQAGATFDSIATKDAASGDPKAKGKDWEQYGPLVNGTEPGVLAFSGATNNTASRITALVVSPDCGAKGELSPLGRRVGRRRLADRQRARGNPNWKQIRPDKLDQNSVGVLTLDPTDKKDNTIYLGTGEAQPLLAPAARRASASTSRQRRRQLDEARRRMRQQRDVPLRRPRPGRVPRPRDQRDRHRPEHENHIFVGSAQAVRGLSHMIGNGGTIRLEPGANEAGLYESTDGGETFTEVWDGNARRARSASPTSSSIRSTRTSSTRRRSTRASGGATPGWRRRRSTRSSPRSSPAPAPTGRCSR